MNSAWISNSHKVGGLFWALLAWVIGVALQLQEQQLRPPSAYGIGLAASIALLTIFSLRKTTHAVRMACLVFSVALLAFCVTGLRAVHYLDQSLPGELEGKDIAVIGLVTAMPQRNETGQKFRFLVESASMASSQVQLPNYLYLSWYRGNWGRQGAENDPQRVSAELRVGERWQFTVRLKAPHGGLNPHGFDFELWLWEQGLQATGYVRTGLKDPPPKLINRTDWYPVEQSRQRVRDAIFDQLAREGDSDSAKQGTRLAAVLAALVIGDQQGIDRADWDIFRATGVAHLMSISGLHVTMFAWLAMGVVGWAWRRSARLCLHVPASSAAMVAGVILALAYAVFSGWGLPSQRTIWMLAAVALLRLSAKDWPWPMVWLLACAVVVAIDPWALMQAGFWLSFIAVGVLFASAAETQKSGKTTLASRFLTMLREQWVITVALTPLTLLLFGQVSLIGLLANTMAIPWVTLVVTPLAILGLLLPSIWELAELALQILCLLLAELSKLPFATWSGAQVPFLLALAGIMGGLMLVLHLPWLLRLAGLPLMIPVLLWQPPRPIEGHFELMAPDIGQGNAVLVQTAKHALLYDAGPRFSSDSDAGHRVLVPLLRSQDVRLDLLVISHRDSDHSGGAASVLASQPKAEVLSSIEDTHALQLIRPVKRCLSGQRWIWDGVFFEVIHPAESDYASSARTNALSCVLRISNGTQTVLLTGDIEKPQEQKLAASAIDLKADLLLVPHHGSKTSSSEAFLDAVSPTMAIIQSGYRNRYGHPADIVMQRYAARKITIFNSPSCGAFFWKSQQAHTWQCQRQVAQRYWHHRAP